jgi:hypothetical protein
VTLRRGTKAVNCYWSIEIYYELDSYQPRGWSHWYGDRGCSLATGLRKQWRSEPPRAGETHSPPEEPQCFFGAVLDSGFDSGLSCLMS